jgi:hypothetical protein
MSLLVPSQGNYGGIYFGGRSSPANQAVVHGRWSGSIWSHSKQRSALGPLPSTGVSSTSKP